MFGVLTWLFQKVIPPQISDRRLAIIEHELRRSLAIIMTSAEILHQTGDRLNPEKQETHWRRIQTQIQQLNALLNTIGADQSSTQYPTRQEWIDVLALCTCLVEDLQLDAEHHQILLTISPALSAQDPQSQPILAYLDPQQLQIILVNLLTNSIKYSPKGGIINLDLIIAAEQITFRVKDSGIGIPSDEKSKLFIPFYRGSNTENIPGRGLGLSLVKKLVEAQFGKIHVTSTFNRGTTFTVMVPRAPKQIA